MDSSSPSNDPLSTPGPYTIPVGDPGPFDSPPSSDEHAEYSRNLPTGTRKNPPGSPNLVQNVDCSPITHSFSTSACGRLIGRSFNRHELPSLIEAIFSGGDEGDAIGCLCRDDAQTFIDVIDEVRLAFARRRDIPLIELDIHTFHRIGAGQRQSFAPNQEEVPQIIVQDVWSSCASSEIIDDPCMLRPNRRRVVQGWICRRLEGGTLRPGSCGKGFENILKQRLAKGNRRELLVAFSFRLPMH